MHCGSQRAFCCCYGVDAVLLNELVFVIDSGFILGEFQERYSFLFSSRGDVHSFSFLFIPGEMFILFQFQGRCSFFFSFRGDIHSFSFLFSSRGDALSHSVPGEMFILIQFQGRCSFSFSSRGDVHSSTHSYAVVKPVNPVFLQSHVYVFNRSMHTPPFLHG